MDAVTNGSWSSSNAEPLLHAQNSLVATALTYVKGHIWSTIVFLILGAIVWDQVSYIVKKGTIAGPKFKVWPIIGPFLESVNPKFEEYMAKWASGPLSCVSVYVLLLCLVRVNDQHFANNRFHKFVVIAPNRDLARKIFNSPTYVKPCVVDVAIKILRPTNWVFLDGKPHVDYRKSLNPLFTRQALGVYLTTQEKVYNKYLERFVELSKEAPRPFMHDFREINCAVSLKAFCGEYISNDQISLISDNYYRITAALELVNFPIILPFTKPWYGKRMADQTMDIFADCSKRARVDVQSGSQPTCILDSWLKMQYDAQKNVGENGKVTVRSFSDKEISETLFTFLFASQDASSSATTWLFQILADRPDIMAKVREEQYRVRNGDLSVPLTPDLVDQMEYTTRVVRECLRYRPPVTMVPYVAKKRFQITEDYAIPKNAMVIPTLYPALHDPEVYENPDHFDPDRWLPGSTASNAHKNWLVFGAGPHVCIGQQYVFMNLTSMMGKAALLYDWKHTVTEKSEKIRVFATIFPDDDCILQFRHRTPQEIASGAK